MGPVKRFTLSPLIPFMDISCTGAAPAKTPLCELAVMEYHGRNRAPKVIRSPMRPRASPAPPFPLRNPPTISPPFLDSLVIPTIFQTPRIAA